MAKKSFSNSRISAPSKIALPSARRAKPDPAKVKAKAHLEAERARKNHQTPEADQHGVYTVVGSASGKPRAYNTQATNLDYYRKKGIITPEQHDAGTRFHKDFYTSRLVKGFKSCLDITIGGRSGGVNKIGLNFAAYESYCSAREYLHPRHRKLLVEVCCVGEWVGDVKTTIPAHRRMDALHRGLDELVDHYESRINPKRAVESFTKSMQHNLPA